MINELKLNREQQETLNEIIERYNFLFYLMNFIKNLELFQFFQNHQIKNI